MNTDKYVHRTLYSRIKLRTLCAIALASVCRLCAVWKEKFVCVRLAIFYGIAIYKFNSKDSCRYVYLFAFDFIHILLFSVTPSTL